MNDYRCLFCLLLIAWIDLTFNHVCAANISTLSPDLDASNAVSLNASDFGDMVSNGTSFGAIDPAFKLIPVFSGPKLRPVPCLLNSVNVALQLALQDFEDFMFETTFVLDSHPQVEISVIPDEEEGSVPLKFAVWGLNIGIDFMIQERNFQTAVFVISYRERGIACITYKSAPATNSMSTNFTNTTQSVNQNLPPSNATALLLGAPTDANTTAINTVDAENDRHLLIAFQLTGSAIAIYDIFYLALDMLRELAPLRRTSVFADATTRIDAANLVLSTRQTNPPRTELSPPYFQVEWLMRALAEAPIYMLEQGSFREVDMVLLVDEIKVGEVSIRRPGGGDGLVAGFDDIASS